LTNGIAKEGSNLLTRRVDAVILISVLVHVHRDRFASTLARILQALKPGGHDNPACSRHL